MPALPDGRYQGVALGCYPSPKYRLHRVFFRLLTGEHIECVMFNGREHAVMLNAGKLRFTGYHEPWLADPDRTVPLHVLNIDLAFDPAYPDRNKLIKVKRTGELLVCDARMTADRKDYTEF